MELASSEGQLGLSRLAMSGLSVTDGKLGWVDGVSGQALALSGFQRKTGAIAPGQTVSFDTRFDLHAKNF